MKRVYLVLILAFVGIHTLGFADEERARRGDHQLYQHEKDRSIARSSGKDKYHVSADLILANAKIFTSNRQAPWAEALAVKDGQILAVGDSSITREYKGPGTRVLDVRGYMVTPGFVDNHTHLLWLGALSAIQAEAYWIPSLQQLKRVVTRFAEENPDLPFIMVMGYRYSIVPDGHPDAALADTILADRPLFLWSEDGHTGWVNSLFQDQHGLLPKPLRLG